MIAAWILYALLVGSMAGAGALALENLLRAHKRSTRWVWAGAMGLSLLWPVGHLILKSWPKPEGGTLVPEAIGVAMLDPLTVEVTRESFLRNLDQPILFVWVASSSLLLAGFLGLVFRTRRMRRGWTGDEAGGQPVLYSKDLGPAVVGFVRSEIVLPAWCRDLEEDTLSLILDHETEHLRAGDLRVLLTLAFLPLLLPWHLPIWWQYKKLRVATEGDCDLRVLRKHPEQTRPYLELLLRVGSDARHTPALVAMLSELEETLERRIRIMTMPFPQKPWLRGVSLAGLGALLLAVACWAPSPNDAAEEEAELVEGIEIPPTPEELAAGRSPAKAPADISAAPTFTPYTVRPDIKNRSEVVRALEREYPPLLRDAGIGGTITVWFFIDDIGTVRKTLVNESSGHQALDEAALRVANQFQFTAAMNGEKPVPVWISLPITFATTADQAERPAVRPPEVGAEKVKVRGVAGRVPPPEEILPGIPRGDISKAPTFTPYTVRPDIKNRSVVARAMEAEYPPLLREAGIGGTVQVWFFIDNNGKVQKTQLNESSGHQALDEAALRVASEIEFTAALHDEKAVPVWISLPITFTTRDPSPKDLPADPPEVADLTPTEVSSHITSYESLRTLPAPPVIAKALASATPEFTAYTTHPEIRDRRRVARALEAEYPPVLRDAGIGGTVQVWFFIDEYGRVQSTQVNESSGHDALDLAALRAAGEISFTPALNRDQAVPVWISLPITFAARD